MAIFDFPKKTAATVAEILAGFQATLDKLHEHHSNMSAEVQDAEVQIAAQAARKARAAEEAARAIAVHTKITELIK